MKKIKMIAHRGYSGRYPGNTELAFVKAAEHGSAGAETDVRITKDGVYVCNHNSEVKYADGTELQVADHTYAELSAKPILNTLTDDEVYICTFRRYLEVMRDNDMICFIELKGPYTEQQIKDAFALAGEVYDLSKCIMQSFDFDNLLRSRRCVPELALMFTYGSGESGYERCFDAGISIDADQYVITPEMIEQYRAHGLEVAVWTVNDPEDLARMSAMDVDYIESDIFGGNDI